MHVELREFEERDVDLLSAWTTRIDADVFMSRQRPLDRALTAHSPADGLLWYVIRVDDEDIGTVWLERETERWYARLGILLGDELLFGLGIGERAVNLALERTQELSVTTVALHVRESNARAIACYVKCGFLPVKSGVKRKPGGGEIRFLRMERRL
jgi:ribosomal protein S18 acetylase RimI-like enzyme